MIMLAISARSSSRAYPIEPKGSERSRFNRVYRVPLVGLKGRKLVPCLQGFCHGAVPFLICSMSREATFLTKASLFISLTQSPLRFQERLRKRARLRQMPPFVPPPLRYSRFQRLHAVPVRYCWGRLTKGEIKYAKLNK